MRFCDTIFFCQLIAILFLNQVAIAFQIINNWHGKYNLANKYSMIGKYFINSQLLSIEQQLKDQQPTIDRNFLKFQLQEISRKLSSDCSQKYHRKIEQLMEEIKKNEDKDEFQNIEPYNLSLKELAYHKMYDKVIENYHVLTSKRAFAIVSCVMSGLFSQNQKNSEDFDLHSSEQPIEN